MSRFSISLRVRYAETDSMRVAYHGSYFTWYEVARTELIRHLGYPYQKIENEGIFMPVIDAHCSYIQPVRYDEEFTVGTYIRKIQGVRVEIAYELKRSGQLCAEGYTIHAFMNREGKPVRPPEEFLSHLKKGLA